MGAAGPPRRRGSSRQRGPGTNCKGEAPMNDSTHTLDLETLILATGAHNDRSDGLCLLEAVAWWSGETHTDHPACVSPILGAYGRAINDLLPPAKRQQLRQLIPLLPGTAADG